MHAAIAVGGVEAIAHITGGGMDNVPRILPKGTVARLEAWPVPAPFLEVMKRSGMSWEAMLTTLNCGIGMVWAVRPEKFQALQAECTAQGYKSFALGTVEAGKAGEDGFWELAEKNWEGLEL